MPPDTPVRQSSGDYTVLCGTTLGAFNTAVVPSEAGAAGLM